MKKRAAAYVRVSTKGQKKDGYSVAFQLRGIKEYAERNDFIIVDELVDAISGTKPFEERPSGQKLLALIDSRSVDAVILWTNDRTGRDQFSLEYLLLKSRLYAQGMELHYSDTGLDTNDFVSNIVGFIKNQEAASERKKILMRSMEGKREKAQKGQWVGVSKAPYGYRKIGMKKDAYLVKDPEQMQIVRRIFEEYTGWHTGHPKPLMQIADELMAEGIPAPQGKNIRSKFGDNAWYKKTLRDIIIRKTYIGIWEYDGIEVHLSELAEIEPDLWEAANKQRRESKSLSKRNAKLEYLLMGMFHCQCGLSMGSRAYNRIWKTDPNRSTDYRYYRCNSRAHQYIPNCGTKHVLASVAENVAWMWLRQLLLDPVELRKSIQAMMDQKESALRPKQNRLAEVKKRIDANTSQLYGIMADLKALSGSTGPARELLQNEMKTIDVLISGLTEERDRLTREIEIGQLSNAEIEKIERTATAIRRRLNSDLSFEQKRDLLRILEFHADYREKEDGSRWMDMRCGLIPKGADVCLDDICVTSLDIDVLDHLVIGQGRWVSLKEKGLGFNNS